MKFEQYATTASEALTEYFFISTGPKGAFPNLVQYTYIKEANVFNLGFGLLKEDGTIDDTFRASNGDTEKILATVGNTVLAFTEKHPDAAIFATGSDAARTRLYRKMLTLNKEEVEKTFKIYGQKHHLWHTFEVGVNYDAFLVVRKKDNKFGFRSKTIGDGEK